MFIEFGDAFYDEILLLGIASPDPFFEDRDAAV